MNFENKLNIITNISIIITFIFTLILIIDELYNIGLFSFKYTYAYNYGSFHSKFNNVQTIECETNRFNVYNNPNILFKDIFNKSYFNLLIKIAITFITLLFAIAYGLYFYETFIQNQLNSICSFVIDDNDKLSLPKRILKCICGNCHKYIPNCSGNYFIVFIILIVIPLSYLFKSFLAIDFTPNANNTIFTLLYVIIFIILIFRYAYEIFNLYKDDKTNRFKFLGVYVIATFLFILSGYIYKYIYNKYNNNITLNSKTNSTIFNDIYRQTPPIKPLNVTKPKILDTFKYDVKNNDPKYKLNKEIVDNYYKAKKNYDIQLNYYTQRYNNYVNSLNSNLSEKINFTNVFLNVSGLNNYIHIWLIVFIIIIACIHYYYFENNILYISLVYLICIFTILTIMNAIQYYNTYLNKYIIYEPSAQYKNDITNANTKLNLILDPSNGENFYNILTNNKNISTNTSSSLENDYTNIETTINNNIKRLTYDNNIIDKDLNLLYNINNDIINFPNLNNDYIKDDYTTYFKADTLLNFYNKVGAFIRNNISKYPVKKLYFHYKNSRKIEVFSNYHNNNNVIIYYKAYQLYRFIEKLENLSYKGINQLKNKYYTFIYDIYLNYNEYSISGTDNNKKDNIDINIDSITNISNTANYDDIFKTFTNDILNNINISSTYTLQKFNSDLTTEPYYSTGENSTITIVSTKLESEETLIIVPPGFTPKFRTFDTLQYQELPIKITDEFNNEYYTKGNTTFIYSNIIIDIPNNTNNNKILIKPKYKPIISYKIIESTTNSAPYKFGVSDKVIYPFNLLLFDTTNTTTITLIKIIMRVLINSLIRIDKFEVDDLKNLLINTTGISTTNFNLSDNFNNLNVENITINSDYISASPNYFKDTYGYLIFLYNIYNYDQNILLNKIEYCIYNYSEAIDNYSDRNLFDNLDSLKTKINKSTQNDLTEKYIKNIYTIKFVIKLFSLFIEKIKYDIETNIDKSLCSASNTKNSNEKKLLTHITNKFTISTIFKPAIGSTPATPGVATIKTTTPLNKYTGNIINQIGTNTTYLINICLYLLRYNISKTGDRSIKSMSDAIISNYLFYNPEETDIDLETLRRELTINCNYYNKYNNLNKKDVGNIKNNANIVAYNFPVLAIILLIFLGESIFIKS